VLPDPRTAVAVTSGGQTLVCDTESGAVLARLQHGAGGNLEVLDLAAQPDGGLLVAVGGRNDHPARVYRLDMRW
jgi:hypothetical protein